MPVTQATYDGVQAQTLYIYIYIYIYIYDGVQAQINSIIINK